MGFDVEVDLWVGDTGQIGLGHDDLTYQLDTPWFQRRSTKLWIHCKNSKAINFAQSLGLNYFFHDTDNYTLTSQGFVWVFPGETPVGRSIVLDIAGFARPGTTQLGNAYGICSDWAQDLKFALNSDA